jgi:hypothetical protein
MLPKYQAHVFKEIKLGEGEKLHETANDHIGAQANYIKVCKDILLEAIQIQRRTQKKDAAINANRLWTKNKS